MNAPCAAEAAAVALAAATTEAIAAFRALSAALDKLAEQHPEIVEALLDA